jgi:glutamate-1-semialdehyde 2,1-aminomutase
VAAGLAALDLIERLDPYPGLERRAEELAGGLAEALSASGLPHVINRVGSLFSVFFTEVPVRDYAAARSADHRAYARLFRGMLERGVYLPPSGYEGWFLGTGHGAAEVERTVEAARDAVSGRS